VAPLPPEVCLEILYRTVERAPELAQRKAVRSIDLAAAGIVDRIVPNDRTRPKSRGVFSGASAGLSSSS